MDETLRKADRDPDALVRGSAAHERMLRAHERAGEHVHNVVVFGAVKICTACPQRWEIAGTRGNYYWEPMPTVDT